MGRGKELVKNTSIIAIGKISTQFISFVLLPLYTAILSTSEYGLVDFFNTYVQLLLPITTLMVSQSVFRFLIVSESEKNAVVSNAIYIILGLLFLTGIIFGGVSLFWSNEYKGYLLFVLISAMLSDFALQAARGFRKMSLYALGGVMSSAVQIILNVVFIVILKIGPQGMFLATIIGNCSCFLVVTIKLKLHKYFAWNLYNKELAIEMLKYSIPLIPNQFSIWILNSSDRTIVNCFLGMGANGILAVSHKFPSAFSMVFNIFQISWHEMGTVHFEDPDRDEFYSAIFRQVFGLFAALCVGIIAFMPFVFDLLVNQQFAEAYNTIPIYMVAVLLNMVIGFLGAIYVATKKTFEIAKTTMAAGIINIVLHLVLVKQIGLYAAAVSTLVSYFIVMIYRIRDTKKYVQISFGVGKISCTCVVLFLTIVIYYINNQVLNIIGGIVAVAFALLVNKEIVYQVIIECKKMLKKKEK